MFMASENEDLWLPKFKVYDFLEFTRLLWPRQSVDDG